VDFKFGYYDKDTQIWDSIAYNAPNYLIAKAAGNNRQENGPAVGQPYFRFNSSGTMAAAGNRPAGISSNNGYQIISTYGGAKNVLTLGAVNPIPSGYNQPSDAVLADFSSWGPTSDGRIKPDVVADGINVLSSIGTSDNAYDIYSGTSMATPAAAGSVFLLQEYYSRLHGAANFMRSATLKGLIIHTADEAGPNPGPDFQYGWGLMNLQKAAAVITSDTGVAREQMILEKSLDNGSLFTDTIAVVASGKTALTATLAWTDPPGTPNLANVFDTTRKLVNDLDLRIIDPASATVYKPWVLDPDPADRPAAATKGDNVRDNVEKVEVGSATAPGKTYLVAVSHKGTLARGTQAYSLLVSGVGGTAYCASSGGGAAGSTRIDSVLLGNLRNVNTAGCKTYSDFTGVVPAQLAITQSIPITVGYNVCSGSAVTSKFITVYIDYNNNGSFTDAGEMVWQSAGINGTNGTVTGNIVVPATVTLNTVTRMRVIAEETASAASVTPCGAYTAGETQDYTVQFTATGNDVGVSQLEYPTLTTCASDSQLVAVHIRNYGTSTQTSVPVTTIVRNGATVVATLTAICKDTIAAGKDVVYTYLASFPSVAGTTYTFTSQTTLTGDLNTGNDTNRTSLTVSAAASAITGTATTCTVTGTVAILKATTTGNDLALWYASATATTPIAAGNSTTTTTIPANKTFYLGVNDLKGKAGPASKLSLTGGAGAYFGFRGNYINVTTSVPLTLESAKMYIGYPGKITFTLATLGTTSSTGYTYFPMYTTTVDVGATVANPQPGQVNVSGDNGDLGQNVLLNIPIPVPGSYIIIIDCSNSTTFVNVSSTALAYPFNMPGVFSITGNNLSDGVAADSLTFPKKVYYPFYNIGIRLSGCPGPRVPVQATTPTAPPITLNGNVFTSSVATGNQWYRSDNLLPGATNPTDTAIYSGVYKTVVSDASSGCQLSSNEVNFVSTGVVDVNGASIGLKVTPNPNNGVFGLEFYMDDLNDLSLQLTNTLGQEVYTASYPNFVGQFSQQINAGSLASGMYVLKIQHGSKTYVKKIVVKR
ncbi:MAG TPA: S8 family serine peptidase, partial [Puia sp.]|nr:S8 family serine peptidase [Puia sp.]